MSNNPYINIAAITMFLALACAVVFQPMATLACAIMIAVLLTACALGGSTAYLPKLGLYAIVAFIPLSTLGALDVELPGMGGLTLTKAIALLSFGMMVWDKVVKREAFVHSRQGTCVCLFALAVVMAAVLNDSTALTMLTVTRYFGFFMLFFIVVNVIRTEQDIKILLGVLVVSCALSVLAGLIGLSGTNGDMGHEVQAWQGVQRLSGYSNENTVVFALNCMMALVVSLWFGMTTESKPCRIGCFAVSGLLSLGIVCTYARSVYLALAFALIYMAVKLRKRVPPLYMVCGVALVAICIWPFIDHQHVYDRIAAIGAHPRSERSYFNRLAYQIIGMKLFLNSPLLGVGPGNFTLYYASSAFRFVTDTFNTPGEFLHNMYLAVACDTGIAGLIFFLPLLYFSMKDYRLVSGSRGGADPFLGRAACALEIALATFLLVAATLPTQKQKALWLLIGLSAVMANMRRKQINNEQSAHIASDPSS